MAHAKDITIARAFYDCKNFELIIDLETEPVSNGGVCSTLEAAKTWV